MKQIAKDVGYFASVVLCVILGDVAGGPIGALIMALFILVAPSIRIAALKRLSAWSRQ